MTSGTSSTGCPFSGMNRHNQNPAFESNDALAQVNQGNFSKAVELYESMALANSLSAEDCARCAHAYQNTGDFAKSALWFQNAANADPNHEFAGRWAGQADEDLVAAKSGVAVLRHNNIDKSYLDSDPADLWEGSMHEWVLCTDFQPAGGHVPTTSLKDRLTNAKHAFIANMLGWIGEIFARTSAKKARRIGPGNPGHWTLVPSGLGQLGVLARNRKWMTERERDMDEERGLPPGGLRPRRKIPDFLGTITPDGSYIDSRVSKDGSIEWHGEGRVGTEFVAHGLPRGTKAGDESNNPRLPSPAKIAERFGYRNGKTKEARQASVHAMAHLQGLVHDIAQTAPDNVKKRPVAVDDPELAHLGITHRWMRADARNPRDPSSNNGIHSTAVWWIMSHIYGSDIETVAKTRTFPDNTKVPKGKLYLEGMDAAGNRGEWLPLEETEAGEKQLLTGMGRNMTAPLLAEHTLYARHHNWVCDVLAERHNEWSDNQLYDVARRVVIMTYVKIHTGIWTYTLFANPAIVDGLTANIFGRREAKLPMYSRTPGKGRLIYRPEQGHHPIADGIAAGKLDKNLPEVKGKWFSKAYRFGHEIVPDIIYLPQIGKKTVKGETMEVNIKDLRELDGHAYLKQNGLGKFYYGMMNTYLPAPVAGNTADLFKRMHTEEGMIDMIEQEIQKDRERGNYSWGEYQDAHNIPRHTQWADLFLDPASKASKDAIEWLEIHYPDGVTTMDSRLGLLLNEHRPKGVAITNEGFQTFVQEATSRLRKNPILTEQWRPDLVGWTAINLVEAIDKEKLLYLHCPDLRKWLAESNVKNTYEYVGTTPESNPEDHPLSGFLEFGDRNLNDVGLGWAWKDRHFQKNVENRMLRVTHVPSGRSYVVDLTEPAVYGDTDNDGRIHASDYLHEDHDVPPLKEIMDAAKAIINEHPIPWPNRSARNHGDFHSGFMLDQDEVNRLRRYKGDPLGEGVAAKLTDLQIHVLMFNLLQKTSDVIGLRENYTGWKLFERSSARSLYQTIASLFTFGTFYRGVISVLPQHLHRRRPKRATGIFGPDGNIDEDRLQDYGGRVKRMAADHEDGLIPKAVLLEALEKNSALSYLSRAQWMSLFRVLEKLHGRSSISHDDFMAFFRNELFIEVFTRFAPDDLKERLSFRSP